MKKCEEKGHKYRRFDAVSLFCRRCGNRLNFGSYYPTWWYRPYPYPYWTWSGTTTGTFSPTTIYTVTSGTTT